jgi:hypothetical protein
MGSSSNNGGRDESNTNNINKTWALLQTMGVETSQTEII